MILSDGSLIERIGLSRHDPKYIGIHPFDITNIQPASIDLRLGEDIIYYGNTYSKLTNGFLLPAQGSALASTLEYIHVPTDCVARVEGKSSIGRQFIVVHCTAGWCDPGWHGNITLEIVNHSNKFFMLEPKMFICQITFLQLDKPAEKPYSGKYLGDKGAQAAKP